MTESELNKLKKDAARYQFLRNGEDGELWNDQNLSPKHWADLSDEFGDSFDQAVDELMLKNEEPYYE